MGVNSIVERHYTYDSEVTADSYCNCLIISLDTIQRLLMKYEDFQKKIYYHYFLHKIHFLPDYVEIISDTTFSHPSYFEIIKLKSD